MRTAILLLACLMLTGVGAATPLKFTDSAYPGVVEMDLPGNWTRASETGRGVSTKFEGQSDGHKIILTGSFTRKSEEPKQFDGFRSEFEGVKMKVSDLKVDSCPAHLAEAKDGRAFMFIAQKGEWNFFLILGARDCVVSQKPLATRAIKTFHWK